MKRWPTPVTDHAVIRYLERVKGIDIDAVRAEISAKCATGLEHGACGVIADGFEYRLEGAVIVTVQPATRPDKRTGRVRRRREIDT